MLLDLQKAYKREGPVRHDFINWLLAAEGKGREAAAEEWSHSANIKHMRLDQSLHRVYRYSVYCTLQ